MSRTLLETPRGSRESRGSPAVALSSVMTHAGIDPRHEAAELREDLADTRTRYGGLYERRGI